MDIIVLMQEAAVVPSSCSSPGSKSVTAVASMLGDVTFSGDRDPETLQIRQIVNEIRGYELGVI